MLASKAGGSKSAPGSDDESTFPKPDTDQQSRPAGSAEEEQIRKFLEALGQPTSSKPPPPIVPRTNVPPRPVAPVRPPRPMFPVPPRRARRIEPQPTVKIPVPEAEGGGGWLGKIEAPRPVVEEIADTDKLPTTPPPIPVVPVRGTVSVPARSVQEAAASAEAYAIPTSVELKTRADVITLLQSASGARSAMILREILGPPRSLQPFEEMAGSA